MSQILASFPSKSKPEENYVIIKGDDDIIYCTCWGWRKHRTCIHLDMYHSGYRYMNDHKERKDMNLESIINHEVKILKGGTDGH
jgi:hypothetical protein